MNITIKGTKGTKTIAFDKPLIKGLSDKHPSLLTIVLNGLEINQARYVINACNDCSINFEYYNEPVEDIKTFEKVYYNRIADYIRNNHIYDTIQIMQSINNLEKVLAYIDTIAFREMLYKYNITLTWSNFPYYENSVSCTRDWDYRLVDRLGLLENEVVSTFDKWHDRFYLTTLDKLRAYVQLKYYIDNGIEPFFEVKLEEPIPDWILY